MVNQENNTRKIVWTETAKKDLSKIHQRVIAYSPEEAKNILNGIIISVEQLLTNPHEGNTESLLGGEKKSYKFITVGFYKVLHNSEGTTTYIRSIFHLRQMPEQNQAKLNDLEPKAEKIIAEQKAKIEAIRAEEAKKAEEARAKQAALEAEIAAATATAKTTVEAENTEATNIDIESNTITDKATLETTVNTETITDTTQNQADADDIDSLLNDISELGKKMGE